MAKTEMKNGGETRERLMRKLNDSQLTVEDTRRRCRATIERHAKALNDARSDYGTALSEHRKAIRDYSTAAHNLLQAVPIEHLEGQPESEALDALEADIKKWTLQVDSEYYAAEEKVDVESMKG